MQEKEDSLPLTWVQVHWEWGFREVQANRVPAGRARGSGGGRALSPQHCVGTSVSLMGTDRAGAAVIRITKAADLSIRPFPASGACRWAAQQGQVRGRGDRDV